MCHISCSIEAELCSQLGSLSLGPGLALFGRGSRSTSRASGRPTAACVISSDFRLEHYLGSLQKGATARTAEASALVLLGRAAFEQVRSNSLKKGDVLTTAQLAGIMGCKLTSTLIPLCHNILISKADVKLELDEMRHAVRIRSEVRTVGPTGVEMEALTAASVAALTVYDMCKAVSKDAVISDVQLERKSGGRSGDFVRS